MKEDKKLFTISQVANICNTSRSTILRMEKDGILSPSFVNEESGYRYYGEEGVLRVLRNLSFQNIGMTRKELFEYYSNNEDYEILRNILKSKMEELQTIMEMLSIETQKKDTGEVDFFSFPEVYCYTKVYKDVKGPRGVRSFMWDATRAALEDQVTFVKGGHPFYSIDINGFLEGDTRIKSHELTVNIPIVPGKNSKKLDNIVHYEAVNTITSYLYGSTKNLVESFRFLAGEIEERNLSICGDARALSIVKSVPGSDIPEEFWVTRICIPVK